MLQALESVQPISAEVPLLTKVSAAVCGDVVKSTGQRGFVTASWISLNLAGSKIPDPQACATTCKSLHTFCICAPFFLSVLGYHSNTV